jgi:hypothetical protein
LKDEGCKILNEIFLENKTIEKINLCGNLSKITKGNEITSNGVIFLKNSLMKNKYLKEIRLNKLNDRSNKLNNEFYLVYKLLKLTDNQLDLNYLNNIYFNSKNIILKLNYLKCFIDEIDHLFFNFHHLDLFFIFL